MSRGFQAPLIALIGAVGLAVNVSAQTAPPDPAQPASRPPAADAPAASAAAAMPAAAASGQAPGALLTIDQAVREALDRNPSLAAERDNVTVADANIKTASLRPNPVLTVNALRADQKVYDANINPNEQVVRTDYVLEAPGKRARRIDQATLAKSVTELHLLDATRLLILDVQRAFVDVQAAKLDLALARQNLAAFEDVVKVNAERVRTGDLAPVELQRSQLAALQFQNDVREQEGTLRVARARLATLLGRDPNAADALDVAGDLREDKEPVAGDALRQRALAQRPDLQAAKQDQARSTADLRLQLANGRIDYTISGEYHRQESPTVDGNVYGAYLSVPLPLFNRNQGEIARARAQQEQLARKIDAVQAEVSNEVTIAFTNYATARDRVTTLETQMLTRARDVRTTTEYSYRRGEASFVELLDAVRAFNDTMHSYNAARAQYARSLYELDAVSGKVNP